MPSSILNIHEEYWKISFSEEIQSLVLFAIVGHLYKVVSFVKNWRGKATIKSTYYETQHQILFCFSTFDQPLEAISEGQLTCEVGLLKAFPSK